MALSVTVSSLDYWGRMPKRRGDRGQDPTGWERLTLGVSASGALRSREPLSRLPVVLFPRMRRHLFPNAPSRPSLLFLCGHRRMCCEMASYPQQFSPNMIVKSLRYEIPYS